MIELEILDESKQKFSLILNGQRVTLELWYAVSTDRWSFNLALDGDWILTGRKIVPGVDLLAPFRLGLGVLFAFAERDDPPGREELPLGLVKLYHATQEEVDAAVAT